MTSSAVEKYLRTRAFSTPWQITGCTETSFAGAIVIPALAESARLFATLASLSLNPPELLARFLVLVVVNQRPDAAETDKRDNKETLARLASGEGNLPGVNLAWIDAASPGMELPLKGGGVGMARKIGHDLALPRLDFTSQRPVIVSLDADTVVEPSYLQAIVRHFQTAASGGAVIPFVHQSGGSAEEDDAITRYEIFIRSYVLGLSLAGSPYAFHTVGSAMACSADAYCRMGGMNCRLAGEDFYFLQQLHRTAGIAQVSGTVVHPSSRGSHRVPFGTGRSVARLLSGEAQAVRYYHPECFAVLKTWLALVGSHLDQTGSEIQSRAADISPELGGFLQGADFTATWAKLQDNNRNDTSLLRAFHGWFDGLRTMKLIHHLSDTSFLRCEDERALAPLFRQTGIPAFTSPRELLFSLRELQNGPGLVSAK